MLSKVTLLLLPESSMMTFASALDPLRAANRLGVEPEFEWRIVSPDGKPVALTSGIDVEVNGALSGSEGGELLIVIAAFHSDDHANRSTIKRLRNAAAGFKTVFGLEAGSWLLARAKIATDHAITTHWEDNEDFQAAFPALEVRTDRYVVDRKIWTAGGASPTLDMMLHYIRTYKRASLAMDVASVFIYDEAHSATDAQPRVSMGRIERAEPRLAAAVRLMEGAIEEPLSTAAIAAACKVSSKTLEKMCREHLGETPGAYYRRLRLQAARKLVIDTRLPIQEIGIRCGFNSQSTFSRCFSKEYGYSPLTFRKRLE
ncbi:MAG: GlxA family transcriptional regulator [Pseudomonadota bacterium]